MRPLFERAKQADRSVVYAEGEDERVLRAVQMVVDDRIARPILIGRPEVIGRRIQRLGLRLRVNEHFMIVNPASDPRYDDYWRLYLSIMERRGTTPDHARLMVRARPSVIAALMVKRGEADAMVTGLVGRFHRQLTDVLDIIGLAPGVRSASAISVLILEKGIFFICDTHVQPDPTALQIADMTMLAAEEVRRFGLEPKVALLSHSNFGSSEAASAAKMHEALALVMAREPDFEVDGEMQGDCALVPAIRERILPGSRLTGRANLLVMPSLDAANIAFNLLKQMGDGLSVGPILLGASLPAHVLTPSATVRGLVNVSALAVVDAELRADELASSELANRAPVG